MVMTAAAAAFSSVKVAYDIAVGARSLEVSTEVRLAISDMLLDAKMQAHEALEKETTLLHQIRDLEAEIAQIKKQAADLENYEARIFYPGVTTYMLKPTLSDGKAPQKLCEHCYSKSEKSVLNPTGKVERRYRQHICPSCKTEYWMSAEEIKQADAIETPEAAPPPSPHYDPYRELREEG
jgi:hypothetical protein